MKEIRKLPQYLSTYREMKHVYDGLQRIKFSRSKEKYKADHAAELKQFYEAHRKLSAEFPDGKFDQHKLDAEYAKLEKDHEEPTPSSSPSVRILSSSGKSNPMWTLFARIWSNHSNTHPTNRNRKSDSFILSEKGSKHNFHGQHL